MTSEPTIAIVWIWLPHTTEPVVCGRLDDTGGRITFGYAESYRARADAVPIYEPELALRPGAQRALSGNRLPLCIDDAMPDSWGRRLVNVRLGQRTAEFGELTYLLNSGSDRFGALDFQTSTNVYEPRTAGPTSLDDLATVAARVEAGEPIDEQLTAALLRGTSLGGARPKALVDDGDRKMIVKFSSTTDLYPVVQAEFVAMRLAHLAGLDVAPVELVRAAGKFALAIERFDRVPGGGRRRAVSALTVLGLTTWPEGRYATYADLADQIRAQFIQPESTLKELFSRISFNILCSNTDDHGRNHAAFVNANGLELTPAYDICPQARSGDAAQQALAYGVDGERVSNVWKLVDRANHYLLDTAEASEIVEAQMATIDAHWDEVCELAHLGAEDRTSLRRTQFLNRYSTDRLP